MIFADEPTGALDQDTGQATMRLLVEAATGAGSALVVVTHDATVAAHCARTITVRDGRLVEDEAVAALLARTGIVNPPLWATIGATVWMRPCLLTTRSKLARFRPVRNCLETRTTVDPYPPQQPRGPCGSPVREVGRSVRPVP